MKKPLMIDLFAGLGGWAEGGLAEGYDVIGFDVERHVYGEHRYPGLLVIQDVQTLHGSQFKTAAVIVASPPCQAYSYRAMPWKRAKALPPPCNALFDACFRIQREACEAAGHHIPLIVENVRGAQPWVGRSRWNFGSFHLWGDVPALMPITLRAVKVGGFSWSDHGKPDYKAIAFNGEADKRLRDDIKNSGGSWFNIAHNTTSGKANNPVSIPATADGIKGAGPKWDPATKSGAHGMKRWTNPSEGIKLKDQDGYERNHPNAFGWKAPRTSGNNGGSSARKMASAMIAKIPLPLSRYIAKTFYPINP